MKFIESISGRQVDAATALFSDGRTKPGYREILEDGETVRRNMMFMDAAKPTQPKSIDEALRQLFATLAKQQNTSVEEMLAAMEQTKLEELAADVARQFVSGIAGSGVAAHFKDSAALIAEAKAAAGRLRVDCARRRWLADKENAHRGPAEQHEDAGRAKRQVTDSGLSLDQLRAGKLARLANAYRG